MWTTTNRTIRSALRHEGLLQQSGVEPLHVVGVDELGMLEALVHLGIERSTCSAAHTNDPELKNVSQVTAGWRVGAIAMEHVHEFVTPRRQQRSGPRRRTGDAWNSSFDLLSARSARWYGRQDVFWSILASFKA